MSGTLISNVQMGDSVTAANNFVITAEANDGSMKLARGNKGETTQDVMTVDAAGKVAFPQGSVGGLTLGTAQATTSGTSIDFTGIPSWVKRITVMLNGVSTNGSASLLVQIGSGSIKTTGYGSASNMLTSVFNNAAGSSAGFIIAHSGTTYASSGSLTINLVTGNVYTASGVFYGTFVSTATVSGIVTLSSALDRIRLTTTNGTDTFDAGSVNIMYEG